MRNFGRLVALLVVFLVAQPLSALSSIGGVSGLIRVPTAEALHYKEVSLSYDYIYADSADKDTYFYAINLGTFKNWELGVAGGSVPDEGLFLNAKYYLMSDESRYPVSIAVGAENLGSNTDSGIYMVASKIFQGGLSAHLGFKAVFNDAINPSLMGGVEYFLTNELAILADVHEREDHYTVNGGILYYLTDDLVLRGSVLDARDVSSQGLSYSAGIAYSKYL